MIPTVYIVALVLIGVAGCVAVIALEIRNAPTVDVVDGIERLERDLLLGNAAGGPEYVVRLHGGPLDGGFVRMSLAASRHVALTTCRGEYLLDSIVTMPDGGSVVSMVWLDRPKAAA